MSVDPSLAVSPIVAESITVRPRRSIDTIHARRNFWLLVIAIGILALMLREYFILVTQVEAPIRGDIREYVSYAWNLLHHHTFSSAVPGSAVVAPDAYRGPGYPLFLAAAALAGQGGDRWYFIALHAQAVLGTATVLMGIALGRQWLSRTWSLVAGVLMALWPHHIAATGALLSEIVFGFTLMLALLLTAEAIRRRSTGWGAAAGIAFGCAYLVNPLILLFPPLIALIFWRSGLRRSGVCLLVIALSVAGIWAVRNTTLPQEIHTPGRAEINFVEGSWPRFHDAFNYRNVNPIAKAIMLASNQEIRSFGNSWRAGFSAVADRMRQDPGYYLHWYFIDKPWLLWDWNIRIGDGDVYFHTVSHSPLETHPFLHGIKIVLHALNPLIFVLTLICVVLVVLMRLRRRESVATPLFMVVVFFLYVTLVHTVFQAEPRYAIPYRPMELLLAVTTLSAVTGVIWVRWRKAERTPDGAETA